MINFIFNQNFTHILNIRWLLTTLCLTFALSTFAGAPEPSQNYYYLQVHPLMYIDYYGDFTNMAAGTMKNGGNVAYYGNVTNFGQYTYNITGYERFLGKIPQTIAGTKEHLTYDMSLENAQGLTLENEVKVANAFKFVKGIVSTDRTNLNYHLHFLQKTTYKGENDAAHVDGYVSKTGNEAFSFPIGNATEMHRLDISAPALATDKIDAAFFQNVPKNVNILDTKISKINPIEYWVMHGKASVKVTLHWRKKSKIEDISIDVSKLIVVGLKGGKWINLGNIGSNGDMDNGQITSNAIIPSDYEQLTIGIEKVEDFVLVSPKIILQGAYDLSSGLMYDSLRVGNYIPKNEPYDALKGFTLVNSGGEIASNTVFSAVGNNAIVDWVFITLRSEQDSSKVIVTKSAFVQRDGDVVSAEDGISPLYFKVLPGRYFMSVQHRNHLGTMTATAVKLAVTTTIIDFTSQATLTYGTNAQRILPNGKTALWGGNTNLDNRIVYVGTGTDYTNISAKVLSAAANSPAFSKSFVVKGYHLEDVDMNGKVIYVGTGTDQTLISQNVLLHPANNTFTKSKPIKEQLPQ